MDLIILKLGGSIVTNKTSKEPKVNYDNLERVSKELSSIYNPEMSLIIIHGAGSFGHPIVKRKGIDKGIKTHDQLKAFAETQRLQNELNSIVTKYLINEGLPAIPCQASSFVIMNMGRIEEMNLTAIKGLLQVKMIPVLYGVPAFDKIQGCSILSGDQLATYLAKNLNAKKIIHATNVDGVFTGDPKKDMKAKLIPEINSKNVEQVKRWLTTSSDVDVTGGMFGKISELLKIGIESQIVNANVFGNIIKAFRGEKIGTIIRL
jgi:isopentenyl phosphate kinase